jgi:two-component system sensor histidine kinase PhoQ
LSIRARLIVGGPWCWWPSWRWPAWRCNAPMPMACAPRITRACSTVYLLLAGAELDAAGALVMPTDWPSRACRCRARACTPACCMCAQGRGLAIGIGRGLSPPFARSAAVGEWRFTTRCRAPRALPVGQLRRALGGAGGKAACRWCYRAGEQRHVGPRNAGLQPHAVGLAGRRRRVAAAVPGLLLRWGLQPLRRVAARNCPY